MTDIEARLTREVERLWKELDARDATLAAVRGALQDIAILSPVGSGLALINLMHAIRMAQTALTPADVGATCSCPNHMPVDVSCPVHGDAALEGGR